MVAPCGGYAQQPGKAHCIGFLRNGLPPEASVDDLRRGLREHGYIEGQNPTIDYEIANNKTAKPRPHDPQSLLARADQVIE